MAKASEAFRNIGEVSVELGIKKHVLRFWELKFPQLKPMKRGGGRRLYRPSDVELLRGIRDLLQNAGYTIKGVQRLLRENGVEHIKTTGNTHASGNLRQSPARLRVVKSDTIKLGALQIEALRAVMAELDVCQGLLAAARADKNEPLSERAAE